MKKDDKIYLTQEGYELFLNELNELQNSINQNGVRKSESYSSAVGDGWHDNFDFEDATREERRLLEMLREKREQLKRIEIVENNNDLSVEDVVNVEDYVNCVIYYSEDDIEDVVIHLIGLSCPNHKSECLETTLNSPIGKAIYGKSIGSTSTFKVGENEFSIFIKEKVVSKSLGL